MTFSLNEVQAMARKATRGAGYGWGLADEAGLAVRWLCAMGCDGCGALARVLDQVDRLARPVSGDRGWIAEAGVLCPLQTGTALSDHALMLQQDTVRVGRVLEPVLILPFLASASRRLRQPLVLRASGVMAVTDATGLSLDAEMPGEAADLAVCLGTMPQALRSPATRAAPQMSDWAMLERLAHRTYAPATEESRARGAGAGGLSDNT